MLWILTTKRFALALLALGLLTLMSPPVRAHSLKKSTTNLIQKLESGSWGPPKWYYLPGGVDVPVSIIYKFKNQSATMTFTCHYTESTDHKMSRDVTIEDTGPVKYLNDGTIEFFAGAELTETITEGGKTETCSTGPGEAFTATYSFDNDGTLLNFVFSDGLTIIFEKL